MLTDVLEIHFINMIKFKKMKTGDIANNHLERWLTFLDKDTPEEVLKEVVEMDTAISKANDRLNFVSQDKEFLRAYHLRDMALSDWTTGINTAMEKGIEKRNKEIARNLLKIGDPVEKITSVTGLTYEEVENLRRELS